MLAMFRPPFLLGALALGLCVMTAHAQPDAPQPPTPGDPPTSSAPSPSEAENPPSTPSTSPSAAPPSASVDTGSQDSTATQDTQTAAPSEQPPRQTPSAASPPEEPPAAGYREVNSSDSGAASRRERRAVEPGPDEASIYEPPLPAPYVHAAPPPPLPPEHVAPSTSLWLGARAGWLFPLGSLWQDGELLSGACCVYHNRGWDDFANSGPMLEIDLGARLARTYNVFALWEFGLLRDGDELADEFGGQSSAHSHFLGLGLRFSTSADDIGILVEMALGWRRFSATWNNGTEFTATDDFFNTRIGIGADIRLSELMSISPMITLGGGVFSEAEWKFADGSRAGAFSGIGDGTADRAAQHIPVTLQVGMHFDAIRSKD